MARTTRGVARRLALTVVAVYVLFFAPNVVRETYLGVALAERATVRVDPYVGLHPDIFEIPGRGAYINSNPGASMIGAVPYAVVRPVLERVYAAFPTLVTPRPAAAYDDPRPNRTHYMNEMRARGLDVRLELAAIVMHLGVNVPFAVASVLLMYFFLLDRIGRPREAQWFALLYAFGTPMFFRSGFLNQNLLVAHFTFFALLALVWRRGDGPNATPASEPWRPVLAGLFLGLAVLCDYSAVPLAVVFGLWTLITRAQRSGVGPALAGGAAMVAGAAGPIALLLAYQYAAFGDPFLPAQAYMPATDLSVVGWHGVRVPMTDLLWRNLFDPAFGLFVFCPLLVLALAAPWRASKRAMIRRDELWLLLAASVALYLFCSAIAFARLQWNTGVRYLVPAVPLLFLATLPVLRGANKRLAWVLVTSSVVIGWVVSMTRESVPAAFVRLARHGLELPWMTVLSKTADAYLPQLPRSGVPTALYGLLALALWLTWRKGANE